MSYVNTDEAPAKRADCGHEYTGRGIAAGYARHIDPDTQRELVICFACAEVLERIAFLGADTYTAYLADQDGSMVITTWTGGVLATVQPSSVRRYPRRDHDMTYGQAIDSAGGRWAFRSQGDGWIAYLKRLKTQGGGQLDRAVLSALPGHLGG